MAEQPPNADPLSTNQSATAPDQDGVPEESAPHSRFKQKKLLVVLSAAMLGGALLGMGGMALVSYLQPSAKETQATPIIVAPPPAPKHDALLAELEALKIKNEKLAEQLKQASEMAQVSSLAHETAQLPAPISVSGTAPIVVQAPVPTTLHGRSAGKAKGKVTADCTVPDKVEKLSDKLKSCIEDFNASTY